MESQNDNQNAAKQTVNPGSVETHSRIAESLCKVGICVRNMGLYGRNHVVAEDAVRAAHESLLHLLIIQPTVTVAVAKSYLALDSFPIDDNGGCLEAFAVTLHEREVGELTLTVGLTQTDVTEFVDALSLSPEDIALRGGMDAELRKRNVGHITAKAGGLPSHSRLGKDPADIYEEAQLLVEEAMRAIQFGLRIPIPEIRAVVADSLHSLIGDESALVALAGIRSYERYLSEHSVNVCILTMVLSRDLGMDAASILELGIAALLHDVGKVFIPEDVVKKPGRLTEPEWQEIRKHPAMGARAIAGLPELPALASTIALEHHIYSDGTGYPAISAQHKPHLLSRLVAIVDTYDALTTDRPYRERWTPRQAIALMLYETEGRYDRQLLARFALRAGLYPPGSLVRLVSGDMAIVIRGSRQTPDKPVIRMVSGSGDKGKSLIDLTLSDDPKLQIVSVAQPVEVLLPFMDQIAA